MLVARRIEVMRVTCGVTATAVAEAVGMTKQDYSKKVRLRGSSFDNMELSLIADFFSRLRSKPLTGWPFVDEAVSDLIDSSRR